MNKIVFFHMNQLGDLIFSLPVLQAARNEYKETKLISFVGANFAPILISSNLTDEVVKKDGNIYDSIRKLYSEKIGTAVMFSESPKTILISLMASIKEKVGFSNSLLSIFLTKKIKRNGVPSIANNILLGRLLGLKTIKSDYSDIIKIPEDENAGISSWLSVNNIDAKRLITISPGASSKRTGKCWAKEKWKTLVEMLEKEKYQAVLIGSPAQYKFLKSIIPQTENIKVFDGVNGIMSTCALLKKSKCFVGIDSGAMHLAASLGTKVIALFGHTDPKQIGPLPLEKHTIIKKSRVDEITAGEVYEKIILFTQAGK